LNLEIVSGIVVGVAFTFEADSVEQAGERARQMLWTTSLDSVGRLDVASPIAV
jgi:hypothetical protein